MAKTGRIKLDADDCATREEAELVLGEHARSSAELETLKAELAADLVATAAKYEGRIEAAKVQIKKRTKILNTWATNNEEEFGKGKKSIDFIYGHIGFRKTTPKVSYLKKSAPEFILSMLRPLAPDWIRTKEEINKAAILEAYKAAKKAKAKPGEKQSALEKLVKRLAMFDLRVTQKEEFYVEPALEVAQPKTEAAT